MQTLANMGFDGMVLTGTNVGSYGKKSAYFFSKTS